MKNISQQHWKTALIIIIGLACVEAIRAILTPSPAHALSPNLVSSLSIGTVEPGLERPCIMKAGAAEEITATVAASDSSTQLDIPATYMATCDANANVRWGATAPTAAAGDFKFWAGVTYFFTTGGSEGIAYFAARNFGATDGSCWLIECR